MSEKEMRENLARIRKERGLTYQDLAEKTGINKSTIQRYETGNIKEMSLTKLELLAHALGVDPAYLTGWEDIPESPTQEYDPDAMEILALLDRPDMHDLKMLFKKTGKLSQEDKEQIARILKATLPPDTDC